MSDHGINPWYYVHVYADGRVIWLRGALPVDPEDVGLRGEVAGSWLERRLTPKGLKLLRSGAVPLGGQVDDPGSELPASAWEDPESKPYVPSRYAVCALREMRLLPQRAQDLLRGSEQGYGQGCPVVVTAEEARVLDKIFRDVGFEGIDVHAILPNGQRVHNCCLG